MHPLDKLKLETGIGVLVFVSFGLFISLIGVFIISYGKFPYTGAIAIGIGLMFIAFAAKMVTDYKLRKLVILKQIREHGLPNGDITQFVNPN